MKLKWLTVLTSSLLLAACGGSSDGGEEPNNDLNTLTFKVFNVVDQNLQLNDPFYKPLEVEVEYDHPVDGEIDVDVDLSGYLFAQSSVLSVRDSEESPLYLLEYYLEYEEDDIDLVKVSKSLQVNNRVGKQLVFALGSTVAVPETYDLVIESEPETTASASEFSAYVFNVADIAEVQPYDIKVSYDGVEQVGLSQTNVAVKTLSPELVIDNSQDNVIVDLSRNGSAIATCNVSFSGLSPSAENQWALVLTPVLGKVICSPIPI